MDSLGYTSPEELLAEKFHMTVGFLRSLNPEADFGGSGSEILVAAAGSDELHPRSPALKSTRAAKRSAPTPPTASCWPPTLGSAVLFWTAVIARPREAPRVVFALVAVMSQMGLLAAILTFAARPVWARTSSPPHPWGLSPLDDQWLAGLTMWVPGSGPYMLVALLCLGRCLAHTDRKPGGGVTDRPARPNETEGSCRPGEAGAI